jgi:selenocysteine lyase/cysteine desulfurase
MQAVLDHMADQPWNFFMDEGMAITESLKEELAAYVKAAGPQEIVHIPSTSSGIGAVANALDWQAEDNVLFCEIEFPSNAYPWLSLERRGVDVRQVPARDGGLTLEALAPLVDENTRLVAASAIQFLTGHRTNLRAVGAFCRGKDIIFLVDAIQAIGHMPIDVQNMHIDVLATGGQKSLLATPGTGFMYVRDEVCAQLAPMPVGPNATQDFMHWLNYDLALLPGAERFSMGSWDVVGWMGLQESVHLLQELGPENIDRHTTALAAEAIAMLERLGLEVISPPGHGPIVTFRSGLDEAETDALVGALQAEHVTVVKHLDAGGVPHVRLSFHAYNTREEVRRFEKILRRCLGEVATESAG